MTLQLKLLCVGRASWCSLRRELSRQIFVSDCQDTGKLPGKLPVFGQSLLHLMMKGTELKIRLVQHFMCHSVMVTDRMTNVFKSCLYTQHRHFDLPLLHYGANKT